MFTNIGKLSEPTFGIDLNKTNGKINHFPTLCLPKIPCGSQVYMYICRVCVDICVDMKERNETKSIYGSSSEKLENSQMASTFVPCNDLHTHQNHPIF